MKKSEYFDAEHYAKCSRDALMAALMLGRLSPNLDDRRVAQDCLEELRRRKANRSGEKVKP